MTESAIFVTPCSCNPSFRSNSMLTTVVNIYNDVIATRYISIIIYLGIDSNGSTYTLRLRQTGNVDLYNHIYDIFNNNKYVMKRNINSCSLCLNCFSILNSTNTPSNTPYRVNKHTRENNINTNIFEKYFKVPFSIYNNIPGPTTEEDLFRLYINKHKLNDKDTRVNKFNVSYDGCNIPLTDIPTLYKDLWTIDLSKLTTQELLLINNASKLNM